MRRACSGRAVALCLLVAGLGASLTDAARAQTQSPFANWAAVFVAGDWHAHSGKPSAVFDNTRRDLAKAFEQAGFEPGHIAQFSARPGPQAGAAAFSAKPEIVQSKLNRLAAQAQEGCLIYLTSHGAPEGLVMGDEGLTPPGMAELVDQACGSRPTVAIVSACFSGIFVPALNGPNRMVLTAARADRTSFGCGEADQYTFFDTCMLQSLPHAHDFIALANAVRICVSTREHDQGAPTPSEPQLDIGAALRPELSLWAFRTP